jgi:hypothetical protein
LGVQASGAFGDVGEGELPAGRGSGRLCQRFAAPARLHALQAFQAGSIEGRMIDSFHFSWKGGWVEAWVWIPHSTTVHRPVTN